MKEPSDWKEVDLQSLIDTGAGEGSQVEFKSAAALKKTDRDKTEISKDVSSFANSAGGLIIYGIDEELDPPHKASGISPINAREFSKEWLEQVINSRIHPHIESLFIYPIDLTTGGVCYVVLIPQSFTAHQAHDRRYYRRFNFESVAMEDYEIRQVMNRRQRPVYKVNLVNAIKHEDGQNAIAVRAVVENISAMIGEKISLVLFPLESW
jgi:predicted HTH transcriptional regulator